MTVFRFCSSKYAGDISGTGAKLYGGRWNPVGLPLLYTSEHISLALLELLANSYTLEALADIQLIELEIPINTDMEEIKTANLKKDWWNDFDYTQWIGAEILKPTKTLLIKCPSAIVEKENNFLINPLHYEFKKVKIKSSTSFRFDVRLFKGGI